MTGNWLSMNINWNSILSKISDRLKNLLNGFHCCELHFLKKVHIIKIYQCGLPSGRSHGMKYTVFIKLINISQGRFMRNKLSLAKHSPYQISWKTIQYVSHESITDRLKKLLSHLYIISINMDVLLLIRTEPYSFPIGHSHGIYSLMISKHNKII